MNEEQELTLNVILNLFIPPSEDGKMPGAIDVGFLNHINNGNHIQWIREGLFSIDQESKDSFGNVFSILSSLEQTELIFKLRRKYFRYFSSHLDTKLCRFVIKCDDNGTYGQ